MDTAVISQAQLYPSAE